ncbi:hypothetical protein Dsin_015592 [Dipteronia sinensis]|uniref:MAPK kinase substrate protein n=1 Tax=Dipteronia sinensis TaxID=43782 RepID=A0AAE0AC38_9ROSI|nr:hypothetical protein Dsin_015592 [Dipteronia sinensis]
MDGLQRSTTSFRRQGSSGLIWDDKLLSGELNNQVKHKEAAADHHHKEKEDRPSSINTKRSDCGRGGERMYRTDKAPPSTMDPPSPKGSGCCALFAKPAVTNNKTKPRRRKS